MAVSARLPFLGRRHGFSRAGEASLFPRSEPRRVVSRTAARAVRDASPPSRPARGVPRRGLGGPRAAARAPPPPPARRRDPLSERSQVRDRRRVPSRSAFAPNVLPRRVARAGGGVHAPAARGRARQARAPRRAARARVRDRARASRRAGRLPDGGDGGERRFSCSPFFARKKWKRARRLLRFDAERRRRVVRRRVRQTETPPKAL